MNCKKLFASLALIGICASGFSASEPKSSVGIVNFSSCLTESKLGKQEQASFDSLKDQISSLMQDTRTQIADLETKLNDSEYVDGLSKEAEEEMNARRIALYEDAERYQGQFYQVINQAQMKLVQAVGAGVQEASEAVAKDRKLSMIVNKEACFFTNTALDVTNLVIAEMDKQFVTTSEAE